VERAQRLGAILAGAPLAADFPLVKAVRTSAPALARLQGAVVTYLWHTLSQAYPTRNFALSLDILERHAGEIQALPNRTPNGVLLPRQETYLSFNLVHQALAALIEEVGVLPRLHAVQSPCNVRVVSGDPDPGAEARPYSSSKIHTDLWNGEPLASILFNIPVLGDVEAVDLRFFEPGAFPPELRVPLPDYALGAGVISGCREYPLRFEIGCICVSDSLSLHQTVKRRSALRLSIDFRAIARDLLPSKSYDFSASKARYLDPVRWRAGGSTVVLGSALPLDAFQREQRGEAPAPAALSIALIDQG